MFQPEGFTQLAHAIKERSRKNIWCYTGYTFEKLLRNPRQAQLLKYIDVLVDGKFKKELRDEELYFRGSRNQRYLDLRQTLRTGVPTPAPERPLPARLRYSNRTA